MSNNNQLVIILQELLHTFKISCKPQKRFHREILHRNRFYHGTEFAIPCKINSVGRLLFRDCMNPEFIIRFKRNFLNSQIAFGRNNEVCDVFMIGVFICNCSIALRQ